MKMYFLLLLFYFFYLYPFLFLIPFITIYLYTHHYFILFQFQLTFFLIPFITISFFYLTFFGLAQRSPHRLPFKMISFNLNPTELYFDFTFYFPNDSNVSEPNPLYFQTFFCFHPAIALFTVKLHLFFFLF